MIGTGEFIAGGGGGGGEVNPAVDNHPIKWEVEILPVA